MNDIGIQYGLYALSRGMVCVCVLCVCVLCVANV